jgi:chromosome segregation ATPase
MKLVKFLLISSLLFLFSFSFAQQTKSNDLTSIPEEDIENLLKSEEEELIGMRLLAFDEEMNSMTREELLQESRQAKNLMARVLAEIAMVEDENVILSQKINRLELEQEKLLKEGTRLRRLTEILLSENAELSEGESQTAEEDQASVNQNLQKIREIERTISEMEGKMTDIQSEILDAETEIESNEDELDRHEELLDSCESVIQSNTRILKDLKP